MSTQSLNTANRAANFLAYFSLGLGALEAAAPQVLARTLGIGDRAGLLRLYGLRELGAGAALLTQTGTSKWMWARVVGDALDIVTLATALGAHNPRRGNAGIAMASVLAITGLDIWTAIRLSQHEAQAKHPLSEQDSDQSSAPTGTQSQNSGQTQSSGPNGNQGGDQSSGQARPA